MTTPILVTGGTGTLGRHVVPLLRATAPDRELRVLSRRAHAPRAGIAYLIGDLLEDEGIEAAVDGAGTVVHLAGGPKRDDEATGNLVRAAAGAGVRHLVYISVIAADRVPLGYFRAKHAAERVIADSGLPWTTLRAAQFHDLVLAVVRMLAAKLPAVPVPGGVRLQPVDSRDVAARLVDLALAEPAGMVPDLAGPAVYEAADLFRGYLAASGKRRLLLPLWMPGKAGRVYRAGGNLSLAGADVGTRTWEDFLAERLR